MKQSDEIYDLSIPMFSYRTFSEDELKVPTEVIESLGDLNRYDYFDFTKMPKKDSDRLLENMYDHYLEVKGNGFEYKDFITNRYFFKQFVIRDNGNGYNFAIYKKYELSNWNEKDRKIRYDSRILTVSIYGIDSNSLIPSGIYKIKVAHKDEIINILQDNEDLSNINFYMLPIYMLKDESSFVRISEIAKTIDRKILQQMLNTFYLCLCEFSALNLFMVEAAEANASMSFIEDGDRINKGIIDYIKERPHQDKKISIDMGEGAKLRIRPKNKNIYSHNNTIIRRLCDYKYQVSAHYQRYWVGSRKDPDRKCIWKWKEAYYKNTDKEFRIIKERVNLEEVGN